MDIRDYIKVLSKCDRLMEIDVEVDWNLEVGAIQGMSNRVAHKACLFNNIKGYPGWRMLGSPWACCSREDVWMGNALAAGLPPGTSRSEYHKVIDRKLYGSISPTEIASADSPCKEVIKLGKEANLFELPIPYLHSTDGGRYLTAHVILHRDPDTGWTNWGWYRFMAIGPRRASSLNVPTQQGPAILFQKYWARGKACPFALAIGGDPAIAIAAAFGAGAGVCEADIVGSIRDSPLEVVRCETNNLLVPARAEVVIEGEILPGEMVDEGPFAEFSGFVHGRMQNPLYRINCITHRKDPIMIFVSQVGTVNEGICVPVPNIEADRMHLLVEEKGLPVRDVGVAAEQPNSIFVSMNDTRQYYLAQVAAVSQASKLASYEHHLWFFDPDQDVGLSHYALEAWALNCDPRTGFHISDEDAFNNPLLFITGLEERKKMINAAKVWYDCTTANKPPELIPRKDNFERGYDKDIQNRVKERWIEMGFDVPFKEIETV